MSRYTVTAERSGKWWVLQAEEAPGAISQVVRLDQADVMKEAIAFVTGEPEADVEIDVRPVLSDSAGRRVASYLDYKGQAERAAAQAATESRLAAAELAEAGMTVRDIGRVLHVSYQRAHQLLSSNR